MASGTFSWSVWRVWRGDTSTVFRSNLAIFGCDLALERVVPQLTRGGWMLIEHARGYYRPFWVNGVSERTFTGFTLSTRGTGLRLRFAGDTDNYLLSPSPSELAADPTYWG